MSDIYSEVAGDDPPSDSFWMPNQYQRTVRRLDEGSHVCNQMVSCFRERARIEGSYARHLGAWVQKWRPLVDASPLYGTVRRAWQAFLDTTERLGRLQQDTQRALLAEELARVRGWQRDNYHRKLLGGFREARELENGFRRAQRPWARRLHKVEKAKAAYHRACRKEHMAAGREQLAPGGPPLAPDRQRALREDRQRHTLEAHKERQRYEQALAELTRASPRYVEEMESVFEQGQEFEQRRIEFLKEALTALQRRLDPTAHPGVQAAQTQLRQAIGDISARQDLDWWRRQRGPGMAMAWPEFEAWSPEWEQQGPKAPPVQEEKKVMLQSVCPAPGRVAEAPARGQRVRAIYDYTGQEPDELSFRAGEELTKLEEQDAQGWCKGVTDVGRVGLYPANYVQPVP
ncbi:protein kinase C and casein kinase substrate in neurons protein 1-like [Carettochelys insculpta]|uniref:protein kinase C and casein kinase substrate in neurons protein 1-like n=1 Tax=Carettochelys insculpta TaxID=44489 RepID=UPI003EBFA625